MELVACEPLVMDPVAIDFDHKGRMFVVEYGDYPVGPKDPEAKALSQVDLWKTPRCRRSDGQANDLRSASEVIAQPVAFRDGVLACTETQIMYLADTDGDNVADAECRWIYAGSSTDADRVSSLRFRQLDLSDLRPWQSSVYSTGIRNN